jgi:hypothetical protein
VLCEEMQDRPRTLMIWMPTGARPLVDHLLYAEKNFSVLPQEISGRSLAFFHVANYADLVAQDKGPTESGASQVGHIAVTQS